MFPFSASAGDVSNKPESPLVPAAAQLKLKNYSAALRFAAELPENGQRHLLTGFAEFKRGRNIEAAELLGKAAKSYPLLADYALYYQAEALIKAGRSPEAILVLKTLQKVYPDSPLLRKSLLLEADTLFEIEEYASAEPVFLKFIEKYPSGKDSLQASYRLAVCREKKGDGAGAAALLRSLWLNSPASLLASKAEEDLQRVSAAGVEIKPYSAQELFKRASLLYEQRRYDLALTALRAINAKDEKKDFIDRLQFKVGQTLLKSRQYKNAENSLKELLLSAERVEIMSSAAFLMASAVEKGGRSEEAFNAYNLIAAVFPESSEADDALLEAAFIRKFQNRPKEAAALLNRLLLTYPNTGLKQRIIWENGWANYLANNWIAAAEQFKKITPSEDYRERALFWHGRAAAAAGDKAAAEASFTLLRKEFPFGFYALSVQNGKAEEPEKSVPVLAGNMPELLPLPEGHERVKALIALGLMDDAAAELAVSRKKLAKGKADAGLARLYLELGNYNGAMSLYTAATLNRTPENLLAWAFLYPKAYGDLVSKYSKQAGIDPSLAFAVMRAESSFATSATSPVGARGLMQLMPKTAAMVLHEKKIDPERLYDPELNIRLGTKHLRELIDTYKGNTIAVIASYNAGASNVNRWLKTYGHLKNEEFVESIPFGETRNYVKKVLSVAALYKRLYRLK